MELYQELRSKTKYQNKRCSDIFITQEIIRVQELCVRN